MENKVKNKAGGKREGAGRKTVEKRLTNYEKALRILDDDVEDNLNFLIKVREGKFKVSMTERVRAAQLLLTRTIPEKKEIEKTMELPFNPEFTNWSDDKLIEYLKEDKDE